MVLEYFPEGSLKEFLEVRYVEYLVKHDVSYDIKSCERSAHTLILYKTHTHKLSCISIISINYSYFHLIFSIIIY